MSQPALLHIDRTEFMYWTKGYALYRTRTTCVIVNDRLCKEADRDLRRGRTIVLTVRSRPFSRMKLDRKANAYVERRIKRT